MYSPTRDGVRAHLGRVGEVGASGDPLPSRWLLTTVGEVGSIRLGRQRSPANTSGRFPTKYVRAANITVHGFDLSDVLEMDFTPAERAIYRLREDDVLLAEASGSADQVGRAAIWQDQIPDCCYQNHVIRFRPHAVNPQYALIVFRHYRISGVFARTARGVGILSLGAARFAALPFPLPPLSEQGRIAEAVNERTAELREAERSLMSALGRLREQDLEILAQAADGRLLRDGQAADEAGQDELPPGWARVRIGDLGEVKLGRMRSPKHSYGPDMRPYLRVANVLEDRIDTSDILQMNFSPEEYEVYALRPGDILLNDGQSPELVGRPAMYRGEVPGACYQNHLIRFRSGDAVDPEFALLVFRHYLHSGRFRNAARWTTNIATLSQKRFAALTFPLPSLDDQAEIAAEARRRLDASASQQETVRQALSRLPEMERELLAMAVAGELVPHETEGESGAELLARLGPPPQDKAVRLPEGNLEEGDQVSQRASRSAASARPFLAGVLAGRASPVPLPELFRLAGFDRDQPSDVEEFYIALRAELGHSIREVGEDRENRMVEVIGDAAD